MFSHCSVFRTTAGCQGNQYGARVRPVSSLQGNLALNSSLHPPSTLGMTSENSAKPPREELPSPAGTSPQGPSTAEGGSQAGTQRQRGPETPHHPRPSLCFQCKPFLRAYQVQSAPILRAVLRGFHTHDTRGPSAQRTAGEYPQPSRTPCASLRGYPVPPIPRKATTLLTAHSGTFFCPLLTLT